jgi:REP element-mobilizing transposase RayT
VHVTLRSAFRPLRSRFVFPTVQGAIREVNRRRAEEFRVVHFSVQLDHVHLIVEARDKHALSSGVRGLSISIARRVNGLVNRRGRVWADRWHGRALDSPRAVRNALGYVLANFRKHQRAARALFDPYSSAPDFAWFTELEGRTPRELANANSEHDATQVARVVNRNAVFAARASSENEALWFIRVPRSDDRGNDASDGDVESRGSRALAPEDIRSADIRGPSAVVPAQSWLLKRGWRRLGALSIEVSPQPASKRARREGQRH